MLSQNPSPFSCFNNCVERYLVTVAPDTSLLEVVGLLSQINEQEPATNSQRTYPRPSCVLVLDKQQLVGLVTERDLVKLAAEQRSFTHTVVSEVMTRQLITCPESEVQEPFVAIQLFRQHRIRHLPIINEQGQPVGLVTPESIRAVLQPADVLKCRHVREVMAEIPIYATTTATVLELAQLMIGHRISCVVIGEVIVPGTVRPLGIVTERDIVQFQALQLNLSELRAEQVMSHPLFSASPDDSLWDIHQEMQRRNIRRLVVTNRQGNLVGIITQTSILQAVDLGELQQVIAALRQQVEVLKNDKANLLYRLNDALKQQVNQHHAKLQEQREHHQLLADMALRIRASLSLETILNTTATEVRQLLQSDRVLIYRFEPDRNGRAIAQSVKQPEYSLLDRLIPDQCFERAWLDPNRTTHYQAIADIENAQISAVEREFLQQLQVRANLVLPILINETLWGLLIAHHCTSARQWQLEEIEFLESLSVQVAIAIQQATLLEQAQRNNRELEARVAERTLKLQQTNERLQQELERSQTAGTALRESHAILRSFYDAAPMLMGVVELLEDDILHLFDNATTARFFATTPAAMRNQLASQLGVPPEHLRQWIHHYRESQRTGQPVRFEYQHTQNGIVTWLSATVCYIGNSESDRPHFSYVVEDISDRKRAEAALRESEARTRAILTAIPDIILLVNAEGVYLESIRTNQLNDLVPEGINPIGESMSALLPPEVASRHWQAIQRAIATDEMQIYEQQLCVDNKCQYEEVRVVACGNNSALLIIRDITPRQRAEIALRESEERYRSVVAAMAEGIVLYQADGEMITCNESAERILGLTADSLIGRTSFDSSWQAIHEDGSPFPGATHPGMITLRTGQPQSNIVMGVHKPDGTLSWVSINSQPLFRPGEAQPYAAVASFTEITERKTLELELAHQQQLLDAFITSAPVGMAVLDRQYRFSKVNGALAEVNGISVTEHIGKTLGEIVPDLVSQLEPILEQVLATGEPIHNVEVNGETQKWPGVTRTWLASYFPICSLAHQPIGIGIIVIEISDRKRAEKALRESEARLKLALELTSSIAWERDLQTDRLLFTSTIYDPIPLEMDYATSLAQVHPEDRERLHQANQNAIANRSSFKIEHRIIDPNQPDQYRWMLVNATVMTDASGNPTRIIGMSFDISDRKQAENALRQSEEKFRQLAENIHQVFFLISGTGEMLYISPTYERIWGKSCESLYQNPRSWLDSVYPEDLPRITGAFDTQIQNGQIFNETYRIIRPDGTIRWIASRSFPVYDENRQLYHFPGIAEDITERKQAEDALQQQLHKALLLQQITDAIRQNLNTQSIFNTAAVQIGQAFGVHRCLIRVYLTEPEPRLRLAAEYLQGDYPSIEYMEIPVIGNAHALAVLGQERAIITPNVYTDPLCLPLADLARQLQIQSMLAVRTSYQGAPNGLIALHHCVSVDGGLSPQKNRIRNWTADEIELLEAVAAQMGIALAQATLLEQQTQRSEELALKNTALVQAKREAEAANRYKSEFLANMSHEIRTPMNAILGFADLLRSVVIEPQAKSYLDAIAASGRTLLALINDILDLSKIEAGKLELYYEPINLRVLIQEIQQIFSQKAVEKSLTLLSDIEDTLPEAIYIDEVRLRQILFNVVGNSLKFTEKGYVQISVRSQTYPTVNGEKIWLEISVEDTGIGIEYNQQDRIFEAFVQSAGQSNRKYGGTGLGLAIARRLTQMMGGNIFLQSEVGHGSIFTFVFPEVSPTHEPIVRDTDFCKDDNLNQFDPCTILVVDDVASNRELIQGYFANAHHLLLFAEDGEEAIRLARAHQPDLILLDLRMPRMDGREAAWHLKHDERTQKIPIVILTASSQKDEESEMRRICQGFLRKPVSRHQLVVELKKHLKISETIREQWTQENVKLPTALNLGRSQPDRSATPSFTHPIDLPELLIKIRQEEEMVWTTLHQTLRMRELQQFVNQLEEWSQEHQCQLLLDYVRELKTQLDGFDWERLPQTVDNFPSVRQALEVLGQGETC